MPTQNLTATILVVKELDLFVIRCHDNTLVSVFDIQYFVNVANILLIKSTLSLNQSTPGNIIKSTVHVHNVNGELHVIQ